VEQWAKFQIESKMKSSGRKNLFEIVFINHRPTSQIFTGFDQLVKANEMVVDVVAGFS